MGAKTETGQIRVSLTSFVDFVITTGTPRIACVREIKSAIAEGYDPTRDFWKRPRESIAEMHKEGHPRAWLARAISGTNSPTRKRKYPVAASAYLQWLGRKNPTWIDLAPGVFAEGKLEVSVNPELGFLLGDKHYAIKLYFKGEPLKKRAIDPILFLIQEHVKCKDGSPVIPAILDIHAMHLYEPTTPLADLRPLLVAEARAFYSLYEEL